MKTHFLTIIFLILFSVKGIVSAQTKEPVDYVNPFIGTDFFGHTFPGASLPFAMVHLSPDVGTNGPTAEDMSTPKIL
jgi:putative alpha-1,2-mannosidase